MLDLVNDADRQCDDEQQHHTELHDPVELGILGVACVLAEERVVITAADSRGKTLILGFLRQDNKNDYQADKNEQRACNDFNYTHDLSFRLKGSTPPFNKK